VLLLLLLWMIPKCINRPQLRFPLINNVLIDNIIRRQCCVQAFLAAWSGSNCPYLDQRQFENRIICAHDRARRRVSESYGFVVAYIV